MTRFNLNEAALLDASGELSRKTREHLHAHLKADARARVQAREIKAGFALLESLPKPAMAAGQVQRVGDELKRGVRQEVRALRRAKNAPVRRRFIYGAMAGVSGLAACLFIVLSIVVVQRNRARSREMAIAKAVDSLRDFMNADADNMTDVALASLNGQITKANNLQDQWSPTESSGNRARLLELVDPVPDEDDKDASGT